MNSEVLTALEMKIITFRDVMLCIMKMFTVVLNKRATSTFRLDIYEITRRQIQEDSNLQHSGSYSNRTVTCREKAWLIMMDSGFDDWIYWHFFTITLNYNSSRRSRYPSGLRHEQSSTARKPWLRVRIPSWAWMFNVCPPFSVSVLSCV
jgi:hypothetical protein